MPQIYFSDKSIVSLGTATAVHELPFGQRIISGVTPPAAGAGAKQFSAKVRNRIEMMATLGRDYRLQSSVGVKMRLTGALHNGKTDFDGILRVRMITPRCELTAGSSGAGVLVRNAGAVTAVNNGGGTPTLPTRTAGDLLIAVVESRAGTGSFGTSSGGWNAVTGLANASQMFWWRYATNDANDNFTWTYTGGNANDTCLGCVIAYYNVHGSTPFINNSAGNNFYQIQVTGAMSTGTTTYVVGDPSDANPSTNATYNSMPIVYGVIDDDSTTAPTLANGSGSPANTTPEQNTFPYTLTQWGASTLGTDGTLVAFNATALAADINSYAAWGAYGWNAANAGTFTLAGGVINPLNTSLNNVNVWLDGVLRNKVTATLLDLQSASPKQLDGLLENTVSLTGDLTTAAGKFLDGTLGMHQSLTGTLTAVGANAFDGTLRMRMVGNVAVLTTGTTHHPAATLPVRWSSTAILTLNYMRCLMVVPWGASCMLHVEHKLGSSASMKQTASLDLARTPGTGGGFAGLHWTGTARLDLPLRASVGLHMLAFAIPDAQRRIAGAAAERWSAPASLSVVRNIGASLGARQTASATLTSVRALALRAAVRSTASASLTSDRRLAGSASILWRAYLAMQPVRPVQPPETDITVSPYTPPVDSEILPVQVESPSGTVHVEET